MVFKERLKEKRTEANLTQVELAEKAGVTARTIQNYELGSRKPSNMVTIQKIADALNTTTEYLLGSSGTYVVEAHEKGGAKAAKDIEELVSEVTGMFAGGELSEDAIEGAYKALTDATGLPKRTIKNTPRKRGSVKNPIQFDFYRTTLFRYTCNLEVVDDDMSDTVFSTGESRENLVKRCGSRGLLFENISMVIIKSV